MKALTIVTSASRVLAALLVVAGLIGGASAEIPAKSKEDLHNSASHAFTGTVKRTYERAEKREHSTYIYGVAEILVERVDKGKEILVNDHVFVHYWEDNWDNKSGNRAPGHYGHWNVPEAGDLVEVFVVGDRTTGFDVISPNGFFHATKPKPSKKQPANKTLNRSGGAAVKDEKSGTVVSVKNDGRTLVATGSAEKVLWEVDVIKTAGEPGVGASVVRHLSLKDEQVTAIYGKHSFAIFELKSGRMLSYGSD